MNVSNIVINRCQKVLIKHPEVNVSEVNELLLIISKASFDMRHGNWKTFGANEKQHSLLNEIFNQGLSYHEFKRAISSLAA